MNRRRVAALLRELADELERDDAPANDAPPRPARAPRPPPRPPTETEQAAAKRWLQKVGYKVKS